ncbi:MAG: hypothetical protein OHK0024_20870 [Thalassobaculales bacterium]
MMIRLLAAAGLLVLAALVAALPAEAQGRARGQAQTTTPPPAADDGKEPGFLVVAAGWFDMFDDKQAVAGSLEYVFSQDSKLWLFTPFVGVTATNEAWAYAYAGIGLDVFWGRRIVTTPTFAIGLYTEGDGKDIGSVLEFRSGLEIAYRFDDRSRLGVGFYHISNAGITEANPGTEILNLRYSIPMR